MSGISIIFKDGVSANVAELHIVDTYMGQLAGTLTVGTMHRLAAISKKMADLRSGKAKGYYYLLPELVDEATMRELSERDIQEISQYTCLGKCLKEQHLSAVLHIPDNDCCHIIEVHWFQTGRELAEKPLETLIQDAVKDLSFAAIAAYCEDIDWLDMY